MSIFSRKSDYLFLMFILHFTQLQFLQYLSVVHIEFTWCCLQGSHTLCASHCSLWGTEGLIGSGKNVFFHCAHCTAHVNEWGAFLGLEICDYVAVSKLSEVPQQGSATSARSYWTIDLRKTDQQRLSPPASLWQRSVNVCSWEYLLFFQQC